MQFAKSQLGSTVNVWDGALVQWDQNSIYLMKKQCCDPVLITLLQCHFTPLIRKFHKDHTCVILYLTWEYLVPTLTIDNMNHYDTLKL